MVERPLRAHRLGSSELILFLLTMMGHPGVFDNAVALVEEVRVVKHGSYEYCSDHATCRVEGVGV